MAKLNAAERKPSPKVEPSKPPKPDRLLGKDPAKERKKVTSY